MAAETGPRLRADALRNRTQVIAAAKKMFAERGAEVPLEEIARAAGVGIGTLYRRFPDRAALIRAVCQESFAHVLAEVRAAQQEAPTAWEALVRALRSSRELALGVQLSAFSPLAGNILRDDPQTGEFRDQLLEVIDALVRTAQDEGSLRPDVGTGDIAWLISLLLRPAPAIAMRSARREDREQALALLSDRALTLMLHGLAARPDQQRLPGRAFTAEDFNTLKPRSECTPEEGDADS